MRVCGTPSLSISLHASASTFQIYAYLFVVAKTSSKGKLISHAPMSIWNGGPYDNIPNASSTGFGEGIDAELQFTMRSCCVDLEAGDSVALGFNMYSDMYLPASKDKKLSLS